MGVAEEERAIGQDQRRQRIKPRDAVLARNDGQDIGELPGPVAQAAAQRRIHFVGVQQHGGGDAMAGVSQRAAESGGTPRRSTMR